MTDSSQDADDVVIRQAEPDDAQALVEILDSVGKEGRYIANDGAFYTVEEQREVIRRRDPQAHLMLVAEWQGKVVGTLEMVRGNLAKNRHAATFAMAILAPYRGRRIGTRLMGAADAWARACGVEKLYLSVFSSNHGAIRLYRRQGYGEEGRRLDQFRIDGVGVDEILMAKFIRP